LIGVYSNPHQLVVYPDGNKAHFVVMSFEVVVVGGELGLSNETTEAGFFSMQEMEAMPMHGKHKERVEDALLNLAEALIK
jgi:hypothetical protein